jgi:hypothetical protein
LRELTAGRGAHDIGGGNLNISLDAARVGAQIAFIGLIGAAPTDSYWFVPKYVTIQGIESHPTVPPRSNAA